MSARIGPIPTFPCRACEGSISPEAAIGKVWWSWFEGGSTDTILRKMMSVAGVFGIEVVVAHLLLVLARESTAATVPSNPKSPYKWAASSG